MPGKLLTFGESATFKQLRYIAILCVKQGIKETLEEEVETKEDAGWVINRLKQMEKLGINRIHT